MAAKPISNIHIVGIVAEWLVAVLETYAHAVRAPERNKPANNPYRHRAGMPPVASGLTGTEAWRWPNRDRGVALFNGQRYITRPRARCSACNQLLRSTRRGVLGRWGKALQFPLDAQVVNPARPASLGVLVASFGLFRQHCCEVVETQESRAERVYVPGSTFVIFGTSGRSAPRADISKPTRQQINKIRVLRIRPSACACASGRAPSCKTGT